MMPAEAGWEHVGQGSPFYLTPFGRTDWTSV